MKSENETSIKMDANKFNDIMIRASKKFFEFDDSFFELYKEKVNFIYANNGVGKTTIYELITSKDYQFEDSIKFIPFNPDKNTYLEKNDVISVSKNIGLIRNAEKKNKEIILHLNKVVKEIKKSVIKITKKSELWSNHFSHFLSEEKLYLLSKIYNREFDINEQNLDEFIKELKWVNSFSAEKDYSWKQLELQMSLDYKYNDILSCKDAIIKNFEEIEEKAIKETLTKNQFKKEWDLSALKCIKDCLENNLKSMSKCYICENVISNFDQIKEQISEKISILLNQENLKIRENLIKFDNFFKETKKVENILYELNDTNAQLVKEKIVTAISDKIKDYIGMLSSWIKNLNEMFLVNENKNKIAEFSQNNQSIEKWKKEKELSKEIKKEDFEIASEILTSVIGQDLNLNYQENNFLLVSRRQQNEDPLPFSNGEKKLIRIILNLIYLVSNMENEENKKELKNQLLVIDDTDDFFDELNKINIGYILNLFIREYKLGFIILTNKTTFIKELSYILGDQKVNLILFYKDIDEKRVFKNTLITNKLNEMKFLNFKEGIGLLRSILNDHWNKMNCVDRTIFFLYFNWLYRVLTPLSKNKVEILKFSKLEKITEKEFKKSIEYLNDYFFKEKSQMKFAEESLSFNHFLINIDIFWKNINKIKLTFFSNGMESFIIKNNIINLIKILFIREKLREKVNIFLEKNKEYENKYKKNIEKGNYVYLLNELIWNTNNEKVNIKNENWKIIKKCLYIFNILDNFIHVEISPTLLLKGIELNKKIITNLNEEADEIKFN